MSRLTWTQRDESWHAGRYQIELAAPRLWVASRQPRRPTRTPTIESTSGSLSALKERVGRIHANRQVRRRTVRYTAALLLSAGIVAWASFWGQDAAPYVMVVFSLLGLIFATRAIRGVINHSWESLRVNYQ